jgi:S-adenosylmethionine:tRNA ribosyltransferase-isomerase
VRVHELDFDLPSDRIAQTPSRRRDDARLLVVDRGSGALTDRRFRDLPRHLDPGDLVVLNDTRVVAARLSGRRATGGAVEVLLTREHGAGRWEALVRPGRRVRAGDELVFGSRLRARVAEALEGGGRLLDFVLDDGRRSRRDEPTEPARRRTARQPRVEGRAAAGTQRRHGTTGAGPPTGAGAIAMELERLGRVPLPPYIRRAPVAADRRRYQTVYASRPGAVAAPTAGLHFTAATFRSLAARGVGVARLCLHVGPGTFRPPPEESGLAPEPEPFEIGAGCAAAISAARAGGGTVCCVGTTVVRALETAALRAPSRARRAGEPFPPGALSGETDLLIRPPFEFRVTDRLITNFHLPRSSPLLLVAAFAGADLVREAYRHAVRAGYRFYSYGDAMLIL